MGREGNFRYILGAKPRAADGRVCGDTELGDGRAWGSQARRAGGQGHPASPNLGRPPGLHMGEPVTEDPDELARGCGRGS